MNARSLLAVRVASLADAWSGRVRRRAVDAVAAMWELLGGGQARNLLLALLALLGMHVARRIERGEAEMARVAEAQGVMGYATMRQLEALGLGPDRAAAPAGERRAGDASDERRAVGAASGHPDGAVGDERRAIDPGALQRPASPSAAAAPAAADARVVGGAVAAIDATPAADASRSTAASDARIRSGLADADPREPRRARLAADAGVASPAARATDATRDARDGAR